MRVQLMGEAPPVVVTDAAIVGGDGQIEARAS
jgi:hypothetical protein